MRLASLLLKAAILVPIVYFGVLAACGLLTPGFSFLTGDAAALGSPGGWNPQVFNYGMIAAGALSVLGGLGMFLGMRRLGSGVLFALLASICVALFGVSLIFSGYYPVTDARHDGYRLGMAILAAPLLMFLGVAGRSDMGGLKAALILSTLAIVGVLIARYNVGGLDLIKPQTAGLWSLGFSLATILWIGLAGVSLDGALKARARRSRDPMRDVVFGEG